MGSSDAKRGISRRGFIKGSAIGIGALGITGLAAVDSKAIPLPRKWDQEFDVVIVGGGGAGFCAAIEACKAGSKTVLLEKESVIGGSSIICGGQLAFAPTALQKEKGIKDSADLFFNDMMKIGKDKNDMWLVRTYVDASNDCYEFLKSLGAQFTDIKIYAGFSVPRSHVTSPGQVLKLLREEAEKKGTTVMTRTPALRLFTNPGGRIVGVKAVTGKGKEFTIKARRAVILTTGGFARNVEMLQEFGSLPLELGIPVAAPGTTGDGHKMAMEVGSGTTNIAIGLGPGVGPSTPVDVQTRAICMPNMKGAVMLNKKGQRFVRESLSYNEIATAALNQPDALIIQIADEPIAVASEYTAQSRPKKADTLEKLAELVGLPPQVLVEAIDKYNGYVEAGKDPEFGRTTLVGISGKPLPIKTPPFYGFITKPGILSTKGGLTVNPKGQVINVFGEIISNLYAAGEIMGGVHGAGYHTGSAFAKALVFGRIAGKNGAAEKPWK
jgi:fumarate reductase flavoprotein subunit